MQSRNRLNRILVGMSSPIGYYYGLVSDFKRPAPIIEFPLGLFLLYEEIWFIDRSLVPYNMANLPFVRIAKEEYDLRLPKDFVGPSKLGKGIDWNYWGNAIPQLYKDLSYDNHSQGIQLGEYGAFCSPGFKNCMEVDLFVTSLIHADLLHNTVNELCVNDLRKELVGHETVDHMLIPKSRSLHSPFGPYNPVVEDLRQDPRRKSLLAKIDESTRTTDNAKKLADDILREYERHLLDFYSKNSGPGDLVRDSVKALMSTVPILDKVSSVDDAIQLWKKKEEWKKEQSEFGWVGYVGQSRQKMEDLLPKTDEVPPV